MRWKTKRIPAPGTTKYLIKFAWLPTRCKDGSTVWLESYFQKWKVVVRDAWLHIPERGRFYMGKHPQWTLTERSTMQ